MIPHWSFSSIKTLSSCPRSWWWQYVKGEKQAAGSAAQFGSAFDQRVLERLNIKPEKEDKQVEVDAETDEQVNEAVSFYLNQPAAWGQKENVIKPTRGQAKVCIDPREWSELADVYGVESEIKRPFIGFIDLLGANGLCKEVLDLKTSSRMEYRPEWTMQTALYALAEGAVRCHIHLLVRGSKGFRFQAYRFRPSEATFAWVLGTLGWWAKVGEEVMRMQDYELPMQTGYHCEWCPKSLACEAYRLMKVEEY